MKKNEAFSLFFKKEWKQLLGKRKLNLWVLAGITALAILSIGFAAAGLSYLERKMSDPFVTCVDIDVDQIWGDGFEKLSEFIKDSTNQKNLGFSNPEQVFFFRETFYNTDNKKITLDGRSFSANSPIRPTILSKDNFNSDYQIDELSDSVFGVILSENALGKLGYNDSCPAFLQQHVWLADTLQVSFSVPILAVVHELPNMCDFLATLCYAQQVIAEKAENFNVINRDDDLIICYPNKYAEKLQDEIENIEIIENNPYSWDVDYYQARFRSISVTDNSVCRKEYDSLFLEIQNRYSPVARFYDFRFDSQRANNRKPNIYSCYFRKEGLQEAVEKFRIQLDEETHYKLDMSKINNLKNLAHIQNIGKTLSYCITGIAILFIVVFLYFLLNMHFQKIQRNIGTFKAFGVDNATLHRIYMLIVFCIISLALLLAGLVSSFVELGVNWLLPIEGKELRIDIFVLQNLLLVALVYVCSLLSTYFVVRSKLKHTPGDLIYNRNQN